MNTIALIGRPNVGKSLLFNRLARKDLALVHDRPGVTRDRLITECLWEKRPITLIDTGGIGLDEEANFSQAIQQEAELAITMADLIFWVVDGRTGLTPLDLEIADQLRKIKKPLFIVINKLDDPKQSFLAHEFNQLGFPSLFTVSAAHGLGIETLIKKALTQLPAPQAPKPPLVLAPPRIAFVGRPNVGKSSLINAVLQDPRTIVSNIPGTTRDAIEIPYVRQNSKCAYLLIDTAGMRHKSHLRDPLEQQMTSRTAYSIQRANLCLLVIDADRGITEQDKKIAGLIEKAKKPCLVLINKWDLTQNITLPSTPHLNSQKTPTSFKESYAKAVQQELFFLYQAPILFVSALKKKGMDELFEAVENLEKRIMAPLTTGPLNRLLQKVMQRHPPPIRQGKRFKILYLTAIASEKRFVPPTFLGFCNNPKLIVPSWFIFLESQLRKSFQFEGCPFLWQWKSRATSELRERTKPSTKGFKKPNKNQNKKQSRSSKKPRKRF